MNASRRSCARDTSGLRRTAFPASVQIEDVAAEKLFDARQEVDAKLRTLGEEALAAGAVAVVTLSGGAGSRWTRGAGVVKALSPFCRLAGTHRTFPRGASGKEPAHRAGSMAARCRTSSRRAI